MLKSYGWWGGVVAHKILETAQSPKSYDSFLLFFEPRTWDLDSGLSTTAVYNFTWASQQGSSGSRQVNLLESRVEWLFIVKLRLRSGSLRLSLALSGSYFVTLTLRPEPGANIKFGLPPTHHSPLNFSSGDKDSKLLLCDF